MSVGVAFLNDTPQSGDLNIGIHRTYCYTRSDQHCFGDACEWAAGFWLFVNHEDPEFIDDQRFIESANQRCADAQRQSKDVEPVGDNPTNEERAQAVDAGSAILGSMVTDLKALEQQVAPEDAPAVRRWLEKWDEFVAVGPKYAAAIRRGESHRNRSNWKRGR